MNRLPACRAARPTLRGRLARGFTLIELLVVIAILSMLTMLVGPKVMGILGGSKTKIARIETAEIAKSLDMFKLDVGRYPTTAEGLTALVNRPASANGWNGPYLKNGLPSDPWGNAYRYTYPSPNGGILVQSFGADNAPGGDGENTDVSNGQ
jgi:general secretion pathway protein G